MGISFHGKVVIEFFGIKYHPPLLGKFKYKIIHNKIFNLFKYII
jgi:hypothetical protein